MIAAIVYSILTSGALQAVEPIEGIFPGGHFCYKFAQRDYASSNGLGRSIMKDYQTTELAKRKNNNNSESSTI